MRGRLCIWNCGRRPARRRARIDGAHCSRALGSSAARALAPARARTPCGARSHSRTPPAAPPFHPATHARVQVLGKQVITRTSGRALGSLCACWVDPGRREVVSFDLDDRKGGEPHMNAFGGRLFRQQGAMLLFKVPGRRMVSFDLDDREGGEPYADARVRLSVCDADARVRLSVCEGGKGGCKGLFVD